MNITQLSLLILLVVTVIGVLVWLWFRSNTVKHAACMVSEIFPVWAAQGPFESGKQSSAAMRYAYLAVRGPEETEKMTEAISKHAQAYDADPAAWEKLRQDTENQSNDKTEEYVTLAKGFADMDSLNKDLLEGRGHKLELARLADGSLGIAYKQIWSDEEIVKKKKEDYEAILSGIGQGLLDDSSEEAKELLIFLYDSYEANVGKKPESASDIGKAYFACMEIGKEEPESEIAKEFERLSDALHEARPESSDE